MYVSTYRNNFGEDMVFIQHQAQPWPLLIVGDDLTPEPAWVRRRDGCFHIVPLSQDGRPLTDMTLLTKRSKAAREQFSAQVHSGQYANCYLLGPDELNWLRACWEGCRWYRERIRKSFAEDAPDGSDLAALRNELRDDLASRLTDDDLRELIAPDDSEDPS